MQIHGTPSQPPRPEDGRRPADRPAGSTSNTDAGRVDRPTSPLPGRTGRTAPPSGQGERGDRLELSSAGRLMQPELGGAGAERLAELKQALREGTLNSRERIELAARRILGARD